MLGLPLLAMVLLVLVLSLASANWARGPVERLVQWQTGRALHIAGDLRLGPGWPLLRVQVQGLRFANPAWAVQPQLLDIDTADLQLDLRALLRGQVLLPQVQVGRPVVQLERAPDGRRSWLLDRRQSDAGSAVQIGRLTLRQGTLAFDDSASNTRLRVAVETAGNRPDALAPGPTSALGAATDVLFDASGTLQGQPVALRGRGASVLGLRDDTTPYPLLLDGHIGPTQLRADGRITGLARLTGVDLQLALRGPNLAPLGQLLGLTLPATGGFAASGRLLHQGPRWTYQALRGQVGRSDLSGNLALVLDGARPLLQGDLAARLLDPADLAPVIGLDADLPPPPPGRVLPDLPFKTAGWRQLDADLQLKVQHVVRSRRLLLDGGSARLRLQDGVLALEALDIATAGGQLTGSLTLDARQPELQASANLQLRGVQLAQLFAVADQARAGVGRVHGTAELRGHGSSLGGVLATADGSLRLVAEPGRISRLLMEKMGLHVLEVLQLSLTGDQAVQLRCAVADFGVQQGVMTARTLALDTAVNRVVGSGRIDLGPQTLDLTLVPHTRTTSLVALRGPIRLHGPLADPQVQLDTPGILARGAGAVALGLVNPLLALVPLVETPKDSKDAPSPCAQAMRQLAPTVVLSAPTAAASAPAPRAAPAAPRNGIRAGTAPAAPSPSRP